MIKKEGQTINTMRRLKIFVAHSFGTVDMKPTQDKPLRPRLLFAYGDSAYSALCGRQFRRQGWEVYQAGSAADVHRLVETINPRAVVVDTNLPDETGWLTCAKILLGRPSTRVVLVSTQKIEAEQRLASFLGAAGLVTRDQGTGPLLDLILGQVLPQTG